MIPTTRLTNYLACVSALALTSIGSASASFVDLGTASQFAALALNHGIDDSGPSAPQNSPGGPFTINGNVGVASGPGQKFQASGSVNYSGNLYLHSGDTYNSSAPGVPAAQSQSGANDSFLAQARTDAINASVFAAGLTPTTTFSSTIKSSMSLTEANAGNYVFNLNGGISYSGNSVLTLNAPAGSSYVLNIGSQFALTGGSILLSGGLKASDVLINYTGTTTVQFSGGGNSSVVYGTILAPNAEVGLHPGLVVGAVIADTITMSSGAQISYNPTPVPEMSALYPLIGLAAAVGSTHILRRRKMAKSAV